MKTSEPEPHSEEVTADVVRAEVRNECREDNCEENLVTESMSSVVAEAEEDGRADSGNDGKLRVQNITSDEPRLKLAQATNNEDSLATARSLADSQSEGYHWQDGLVFQTRLNKLGDNMEELCLPKPYRSKCLRMSHDNFGHMGQNKIGDHIRKYFYWSSITADSMLHIRSCNNCQKCDKTHPKGWSCKNRKLLQSCVRGSP